MKLPTLTQKRITLARCKEISLYRLCFADDLMVFINSDVESMQKATMVFYQFYLIYSLKYNPSKCDFFCYEVSSADIQRICRITLVLS
jgi:hypothetical protein